jgi:uncharacterized protein YutE (UPF0331/DUF86 family)
MTTINVVESKLREIDEYYSLLLKYREYSREKIEEDFALKGSLERYLYLLCQAAMEAGEALIAFKGFYRPGSYSDIFEILKAKEIIDFKMTQNLIKMTAFRNAIAHDYEKFDFGIAYQVLMVDMDDIKNFELIIKKYLNL